MMTIGTNGGGSIMGRKWAWYAVPVLAVILTIGCDRNPEQRAAIENLNNHPEIVQRGGVVKEIEMREPNRGVHNFRADILDAQGNVIGTVTGARVENFGTRINRIRWEGEPERRGRGDGRGQGRQRPEEAPESAPDPA